MRGLSAVQSKSLEVRVSVRRGCCGVFCSILYDGHVSEIMLLITLQSHKNQWKRFFNIDSIMRNRIMLMAPHSHFDIISSNLRVVING